MQPGCWTLVESLCRGGGGGRGGIVFLFRHLVLFQQRWNEFESALKPVRAIKRRLLYRSPRRKGRGSIFNRAWFLERDRKRGFFFARLLPSLIRFFVKNWSERISRRKLILANCGRSLGKIGGKKNLEGEGLSDFVATCRRNYYLVVCSGNFWLRIAWERKFNRETN